MPSGKYLTVMLELWLPPLAAAGDLDKPLATDQAVAELKAMSAATVDRYLKPARDRMRIKGISTTKPFPLLRNSIAIRTYAEEAPEAPGVIEADTVAHCGPTLLGEFARTLTMTDLVTGWTENASNRNKHSGPGWYRTSDLPRVRRLLGHYPSPRNTAQTADQGFCTAKNRSAENGSLLGHPGAPGRRIERMRDSATEPNG